ncbi:MAG: PepSY domain-containing protein [Gammaproteobacteria bacterium]|nr:PepSY domain-containing protein [Gammaproteobacteria bacterium]
MSLPFACLLFSVVLFWMPPGLGQAAQAPVAPNPLEVQRLTMDEAVRVAKRAVRGRVLAADRIESLGPLVYRIKVLLDTGRVRTVYVDGETGDIIDLD